MDCFSRLHRHAFDGVAVYIDPLLPDWFVPSSRTDALLTSLHKEATIDQALARFCGEQGVGHDQARADYEQLVRLLQRRDVEPYQGRGHSLQLAHSRNCGFI